MEQAAESDTITRLNLGDREVILVGTAHVSRESVDEVRRVIEAEEPDDICVEIDETRYKALTQKQDWSGLNIQQVLKERKGFLLMANLVLSAFQRRIGADLGVVPGEEMKTAVEVAREKQIRFHFCDRQVQTTLRRAWVKSGLWSKNKMLAALISSIFSSEKLSDEDIEKLKRKSALQDMMEELARYLPSVKEVLIDERDRYLATRIYESGSGKTLAVIGAGHVEGIVSWLRRLESGELSSDLSDIDDVPPRGSFSRLLPWMVPAVVVTIIVAGFFRSGLQEGLSMMWLWVAVNGTLSGLGALLALAHPLTIAASFAAAPITSLNPTIGVGMVSGILQAIIRKPRVKDFESLHQDMMSLRGFYRNRVTHALLVFFFSSIGSVVGTFIGIPWLMSLLA